MTKHKGNATRQTERAGWQRCGAWTLALLAILVATGCAQTIQEMRIAPPARAGGNIVVQTAAAQNSDPAAAGAAAAEALRTAMGGVEPQAVLIAECFGNKAAKTRALQGVCSVFPCEIVYGGATYGSFSQAGCLTADSVGLLGIGGDGISVAAALERDMGTTGLSMETDREELVKRLGGAGSRLAGKLPVKADSRLALVIADAHSPKNQLLIEGMQEVLGKGFSITGGCVNKNVGETYIYFQGRIYEDAALTLLLSGDFKIGMDGRKAQENDAVIATAEAGAAQAIENLRGEPFALLAFDCAGRKGKLDDIETELKAIQKATGSEIPIFGSYNAGEIGPADPAEREPGTLSSGKGWHVMFTALGR